jgi:hypothetical protein
MATLPSLPTLPTLDGFHPVLNLSGDGGINSNDTGGVIGGVLGGVLGGGSGGGVVLPGTYTFKNPAATSTSTSSSSLSNPLGLPSVSWGRIAAFLLGLLLIGGGLILLTGESIGHAIGGAGGAIKGSLKSTAEVAA